MAFSARITEGNVVKNLHGTIFVVQGIDYACSGGACGQFPVYFGRAVNPDTTLGDYAQGMQPVKLAEDLAEFVRLWSV